MSKFTERLRDENYAGPMQHLRSHVEIDALFNQSADIIDEMERVLVVAEKDAESWVECEAVMTEHGFDVGPSRDVLHEIRNTLTKLERLK